MKSFFLKIKLSIFVLSIGLTPQIAAQDGAALRDLGFNPSLINAKKSLQRKSEAPPLRLPFFEDFSSLHSPYPNPELWEDNMVFINASFPLFPPTIGVATFDALDANGRLYEHAASYPFGADTLTSRPIRLDSIFGENTRALEDALTEGDTVWFSFYYQPGGGFGSAWNGTLLGRRPKYDDALVLEFRNGLPLSLEDQWVEQWRADGQSLEQFCPLCVVDSVKITDTTFRFVEDYEKEFFKHVKIPITLVSFLYNGFQFRFRNYSSLDQDQSQNQSRQSSGGQWHVDYIRLDVYPDGYSEFSSDIAFVQQGKRVLKDFQAMPAKQFQGSSDLVTEIPLLVRNLDRIFHPINYYFQITGPSYFWDTTSSNADIYPFIPVNPLYPGGFNAFGATDVYAFQRNFRLPNITTPSTFRFQHVIKSSRTDIGESNDTMIQTVHFGDYYAYDDGTSEVGFGFLRQNERAASQFAYRFPMRVADSLVGIQIWFNHTLANTSRAFFNLAVWTAQDDGTPSQNPSYVGQDILPAFDDVVGYFTYWLEDPMPLSPGEFFIGFQQRNNFFLNIGFDQNNNAENRMLQKLGSGSWDTIFYYGSVMMRPVFGTRESIPTSIFERDDIADIFDKIRVYPNPSDGLVFVESPENVVNSYEIYDLSGRRLLQRTVRATQFSINLPEAPGFYILLLHTEKGLVSKKVVRQ